MKIPPLPPIEHEETEPSINAASTKRCWKCNAGPNPPSLDEQVEILRDAHQSRTEIFHLRESEARRLRALLQEGDVIALVRNVQQRTDPMYSTVAIWRDGNLLLIDRRELQDA